MLSFCWLPCGQAPPHRLDLRARGWNLCRQGQEPCAAHGDVVLLDRSTLDHLACETLVRGLPDPQRLLILGVGSGAERASLLNLGCGEVLPGYPDQDELAIRAARVAERCHLVARRRMAGPLELDLVHRDALIGGRWLALHPREFGLLWRLAQAPGRAVSRSQLLLDVWRMIREPETNSLDVHICRLRTKLALAGERDLIRTLPGGGYFLATAPQALPATSPPLDEARNFCENPGPESMARDPVKEGPIDQENLPCLSV